MLIAEDKNSDKQSNNIGKIVNRAIAAWNIKNYKYDLIKNRENCVFCVTTPERVTSLGKSGVALATLFCTFTAAISGFTPCLKNI